MLAHAENLFSRLAINIPNSLGDNEEAVLKSPDKRTTLKAKWSEKGLSIEIQRPGPVQKLDIGLGVGAELLWAPDSSAFAISSSDGGLGGIFNVHVFVRSKSGEFRALDLMASVFSKHVISGDCPITPNVVAVTWLGPPHRLVVAVQRVHYSSICGNAETFVAYEVRLEDLKIIKTYSQLESKGRFGRSLGVQLRKAPDDCLRNPGKCRATHDSNAKTANRN